MFNNSTPDQDDKIVGSQQLKAMLQDKPKTISPSILIFLHQDWKYGTVLHQNLKRKPQSDHSGLTCIISIRSIQKQYKLAQLSFFLSAAHALDDGMT